MFRLTTAVMCAVVAVCCIGHTRGTRPPYIPYPPPKPRSPHAPDFPRLPSFSGRVARAGEAAAADAPAASAGAYFFGEMIRHETDDTRRAELQQAVDSSGGNNTVLDDAAASVVGRLMNVDDAIATRMLQFIQRAGTMFGSSSTEIGDDAVGGGGGAVVDEETVPAGTWIGANAALNSMLRESNLTARGGRLVVAGSEADMGSTDAAAQVRVFKAHLFCAAFSNGVYLYRGQLGDSTHII